MKPTGERRSGSPGRSIEERVLDLLHAYPYRFIRDLATGKERLLEVGFGEGYGTQILGNAVGEYHGLEVSKDAARHASAKYRDSHLTFHHYDGKTFPFPDHSFDIVISFQVIEHLNDVQTYLEELRRTCKPGGTIAITTPNRTYRLHPGERPWNRHHITEFDTEGFGRVLESCFQDFEILGISGTSEVQRVERRRVARLRRLAKIDVLQLRHLLPSWITHAAGKVSGILSRGGLKQSLTPDAASPALEDIELIRDRLDESLVLLALIPNSGTHS